MKNFAFISLGLLVVLFLSVWAMYGDLNSKSKDVEESVANIQSTEQRRNDLLPNLVAVVKGYAAHEKGVFTEVTNARAKVGQINFKDISSDPKVMAEFVTAQKELSGALSKL